MTEVERINAAVEALQSEVCTGTCDVQNECRGCKIKRMVLNSHARQVVQNIMWEIKRSGDLTVVVDAFVCGYEIGERVSTAAMMEQMTEEKP